MNPIRNENDADPEWTEFAAEHEVLLRLAREVRILIASGASEGEIKQLTLAGGIESDRVDDFIEMVKKAAQAPDQTGRLIESFAFALHLRIPPVDNDNAGHADRHLDRRKRREQSANRAHPDANFAVPIGSNSLDPNSVKGSWFFAIFIVLFLLIVGVFVVILCLPG